MEKCECFSSCPVKTATATGGAAPMSKYSRRVLIKTILTSEGQGIAYVDQVISVGGWVKTGREQGKGAFAFLELNDGSCPANLQVMVDASVHALGPLTPTGTSLVVEGELKRTPPGTKQTVELKVTRVIHLGTCDPSVYPIAKTNLSLEYLRSKTHLRGRTNTISAIARIRSALAFASHKFFVDNGFLYVHTPIVTTSDCEGAGEMFQVTTLLSEAERRDEMAKEAPPPTAEELQAAAAKVEAKGSVVRTLKEAKKGKEEIKAAVEVLQQAKEEQLRLEERMSASAGGLPKTADGRTDYGKDFFCRQAYLTVSGQLQVETYACGLSSCYTFGPTFRAEYSHTTRHLAEFWMIEPEIAFADLEDDMNCAEDYVRYLCRWLLDNCRDDMEFMEKRVDKTCVQRLENVANNGFARVTYTEAIEILEKVDQKSWKTCADVKVEWGIDLSSEHERYLTEEVYKRPVIVYNYPAAIKAFYMRLNEDGRTVAAMDVLVPKVGELIGGSQREERFDVLERRIKEAGLPTEPYSWYLDLRRFGTVKHAGFGLGFERMILFATGLENIRDVIPFPRYPGHADL
eukprot:TRINITY_DN305_c0_g1_i1.p1 TRINITY_DN305_c0_g1~~TRINITY_DN305_c0_g1_i1.p1  ORF type:complete len:573 (-),score=112.10 TRINITY_DN305_c0_g1_i1:634-2352(-)